MLPLHLSTTHNFRVLRVVRFDKSSAILVSTASTAFQCHHDKQGRCGGHHLQTKHSSTLSHHEAVTSLQVKLKCLERMHSHIYNIPFYTLILAGTRGTDYLWKYIFELETISRLVPRPRSFLRLVIARRKRLHMWKPMVHGSLVQKKGANTASLTLLALQPMKPAMPSKHPEFIWSSFRQSKRRSKRPSSIQRLLLLPMLLLRQPEPHRTARFCRGSNFEETCVISVSYNGLECHN